MDATIQHECYHCGLSVPAGFNEQLEILGQPRRLCCLGCYSVAETIINNGLSDYYKFRTEDAITPDQTLPEELSIYDEADIQEDYLLEQNSSTNSILLLCDAIRCSACAWLLEKKMGQLQGVKSVTVNVSSQTLCLSWQPEVIRLSDLLAILHKLGYAALPFKAEAVIKQQEKIQKSWLRRLGLAGLGMMQVMMYAVALYIGVLDDMSDQHRNFLRWVSFIVATPILFYAGKPFYISAYRSLKQWQLNMDVPISIALFLAYCASIWATLEQSGEVYFDSVTMFVFFLLIGRYLEFRARQQVSNKLYQGHTQLPSFVQKEVSNNQYQAVPSKKIVVGDKVLVKAGETFALDGVVVEGDSQVNEAMLNGEFMPIHKKSGDHLLAASVNITGPLVMEVTAKPENSYWSTLLLLQEQALLDKPLIGLLADKVARYFVAFILLLTIIVAWYWNSRDPDNALWICLSVLVVSCPCALSLATPIAMTCGALSLNQKNILIKGQHFLTNANAISDVIFDKTGTLTKGALVIDNLEVTAQMKASEIVSIIAQLESQSEHPIAKAFEQYKPVKIEATHLTQHPFSGVSGSIANDDYYFGNYQFIESLRKTESAIINEHTRDNDNFLYLAKNRTIIAKVLLKDELREHARKLAQTLKNKGIKLHLLSGDPSSQVEAIAKELKIGQWHNDMKPEQKLDYLKQLQSEGRRVLVVGDGINDAPVMAAANASVAMANAADITRVTADAYLMSAHLMDIDTIITKSKQTQAVIQQNLFWALFYNALMIPFAASGFIAPYVAAIGMSLSSIVVVVNSLKLKR